jgi:hypothetical protein
MRTCTLLICLCLATLGSSFAAEARKPEPPPPKPKLPDGTPAEQVKVLSQQFDDVMAAFRKRYEAAASDAEQMKLVRLVPDSNGYAALFVQIAEKSPNDPAALDALLWVVRHVRGSPGKTDTPYARARAVLSRDHLKDPKIGPFCLSLRYEDQDPQVVALLRRVLTENPDKGAQAQAAFSLAKLLRRRASFADALKKADAKDMMSLEKYLGKEAVAEMRKVGADAIRKESEALLERLAKEKAFAATVIPYGEKKVALGELADRELFEIRHLQPGRPAPEITGEDIDGRPMKLSVFRGKVVLLDFWGHW